VNSNSCGRGLVVFSLTLIFGLSIADQFVQSEEFVVESPIPLTESVDMNGDEKILNCIQEYDVIKLKENRVIFRRQLDYQIELIKKRVELEAKLENLKTAFPKTPKLEQTLLKLEIEYFSEQLEKVSRKIRVLKDEDLLGKNWFDEEIRNENLLYSTNCYELEF
jgi:hypothetical protein